MAQRQEVKRRLQKGDLIEFNGHRFVVDCRYNRLPDRVEVLPATKSGKADKRFDGSILDERRCKLIKAVDA